MGSTICLGLKPTSEHVDGRTPCRAALNPMVEKRMACWHLHWGLESFPWVSEVRNGLRNHSRSPVFRIRRIRIRVRIRVRMFVGVWLHKLGGAVHFCLTREEPNSQPAPLKRGSPLFLNRFLLPLPQLCCPVVPLFSFFGEGFPFKLNQQK